MLFAVEFITSQWVVFGLEYENGHVLLLCLSFAGFQQKGRDDMPKGYLKKKAQSLPCFKYCV